MPNSQRRSRRIRIVTATLYILIIVAVACSSDSSSGSSATVDGSYESCKGFIDSQLIEGLTGESDLVERERVLEVGSTEELAESGITKNCLIEVFGTVGNNDEPAPGDSITLSIVKFESNELAISLFDSTLASALLSVEQVGEIAEIEREVIGVDSYLMDIKVGGIGAIVVYVSDSVFISISSTADSAGNALLDGWQLVTAAQGVQSRLPQ